MFRKGKVFKDLKQDEDNLRSMKNNTEIADLDLSKIDKVHEDTTQGGDNTEEDAQRESLGQNEVAPDTSSPEIDLSE